MHRCIRPALFLLSLLIAGSAEAQNPVTPLVGDQPSSSQTSNIDLPKSDEDWSTIELAKSKIPVTAIGAMPISKVDLPGGCTRELFRMQWRINDPIDLYVIRPTSSTKLPVVLFLYNYNVDTDVFRQDRWCDVVNRNGVAAVGFPSALSLQRLHTPRPMKEWFVSELQEALATTTHDVQMVLNYLETRSDLDVHRVAVFGEGSGGAVAILAAAADQRIVALDLMNPWGDWPDFLHGSRQIPEEERAAYLQPEFLQKVAGLDPLAYLPKLKTQAIRVQMTDTDPVVPSEVRTKMAAAVPAGADLARYPNQSAVAAALGTNGIIGWLKASIDKP